MKELIRKNFILFNLFFLYLGAGLVILVVFEKGELELLINKRHHPYLDEFFLAITYLGDGRVLVPLIILASLRKRYNGLLIFLTFIISTIIVQSMKRTIFAEYPRPSKFFEKLIEIRVIEGLELHSYYSFPSGHASGAFAVFFMWGLLVKNKMYAVLFFFLALLTAFSRIYLMQHFFVDTYFGALFGVLIAVIIFYYLDCKSTLSQKESLQKPLFSIFNKK